MPECLIVGDSLQCQRWQMMLEDQGEDWRCTPVSDAQAAYALLMARYIPLAVLCAGVESTALIDTLCTRPPLSPPWLIGTEPASGMDAMFLPEQASALAAWLQAQEDAGRLPRLALMRHTQLTCLARGLLTTLDVPARLRVWAILPDMAAMAAVHPPLLYDLRGRLYPLAARRHGLTAAAVERRLRLAVESTWNHASLAALERFFGHSVDPERGKPTNKEFLYQVQQRLLLAGQRIA